MEVKITEALWKAIGAKPLTPFKLEKTDFSYKKYTTLDLAGYPPKQLAGLAALIEPHKEIKGAAVTLRDLRTWLRVIGGDEKARPRTVQQAHKLMTRYLAKAPGHRLYKMDPAQDGTAFAYYVAETEYCVPYRSGEKAPPFVHMKLFHREFGVRDDSAINLFGEDCIGKTVGEALADKGYCIETPELRTAYLADVEAFERIHLLIGRQYLARGTAMDNLDGNPETDRWSSHSRGRIRLDRSGEPAHVVVDVFRETDKESRDHERHMDLWFWTSHSDELEAEESEDESKELSTEDTHEERPNPEVPMHPLLAVFDLRRHLRLRIHVANLTEYQYDTALRAKLILPRDTTDLVDMLVGNTGVFQDIVRGKSGGAIVLCAGPPGVGKTLTAEVYSEAMERPLYSVQCSQLGTDPDVLEAQLFKVFARSQRWNAILLLDEADVYVAARGTDLDQNAIVGVFLRVLEYYAGVMFLTTNRAELVDDAIASRCVARIAYKIPNDEDQRRIWRVLSDSAGIPLSSVTIEEIVEHHPKLSGRDIKNLLKLGAMVSNSRGKPIDCEVITFVKRFKPTADYEPDVSLTGMRGRGQ